MTNTEKNLPNIVILIGPTAIGKTNISLSLAERLKGEIISADSAQVYKYMDIGTAKIKPDEMHGIKHYMIDEVYPDESFSVADFRRRAEKYIHQIAEDSKLPIITGGTGLYINSLLNNLDFTNSVGDESYRLEMAQIAEEKGNGYLHGLLKEIDPQSFEKLHVNDVRRIIRALEVYKFTGKPISFIQEESKKIPPRFNYAYVGLTMDRERLYQRIEKRVDMMIENGLIDEVEKLLNMGYTRNLPSLQALGYKEVISYLEGDCSLEETMRILKRDSRHYAKRQLTWFRRDLRITWFDIEDYHSHAHIVENIVNLVAGNIILI